jgi:hypothetical protein
MLCDSSVSGVIGYMIVIEIDALSDFIVKGLFSVGSQKWETRDAHEDLGFASEEVVSLSKRVDMLVKVAGGCVGLTGDDFEHP